MTLTNPSRSARVRARLSHPVIDADGHSLELTPVLLEYVKQIGGSQMPARLTRSLAAHSNTWFKTPEAQRRDSWSTIPGWWTSPMANTLDRATASLPRLLHGRLDELGIDFAVLYPTQGLMLNSLPDPDPELRLAACRAVNTYYAELYGAAAYRDRMTPAAVIPMHTPDEALQELEYAVGTLGFKAVLLESFVRRPIPMMAREHPDIASVGERIDTFALDSDYDYSPVWAKCAELRVTPTCHTLAMRLGFRRSLTSFVYNHIGHFATGGEAACKSLFLGGVTRRFPNLNFAFLEGGVAWACALYTSLIAHWETRNPAALRKYLDPAALDVDGLLGLIGRHGEPGMQGKLAEIRAGLERLKTSPHPANLDEFGACGIEQAEDIRDRFEPYFYFGCEADDPLNVMAFSKALPFGARLKAMMGSDIGHFDVRDMRDVVAEAYESVERGLMTGDDFRDFVFTNAVTLYGRVNPDFFKGTRVERAAAGVLEHLR